MDSQPISAPNRHFTTVLLVAVLLLPAGLNLWLYWLGNPLYGHGLWVVPLAGLLAWRRLGGLVPAVPGWAGLSKVIIVLCLVAMPFVRVVQIANPDWRMVDWLLLSLSVSGLLALSCWLGGLPATRALWFPIVFLFTAAPWPTWVERAFTDRAVPLTATLASEVLWSVGVAAVDDGRMLLTVVGPVEVSEDCSGIRGLQLAVMGSLFWAGWLGFGVGRTFALLGGAFGLSVMLNVLRVVAIVLAAQRSGQLAVAEQWHDPAGTAAQLALVLGLPVLAKLLCGKPAERASVEEKAPAPWRVVSVRAALAAALWIGLGELAGEWWFRRNETAVPDSAPRWTMQRSPAIEGAKEYPVPVPVRRNYRYSDAISLAWSGGGEVPWTLLWMEFERGAQSACTHNVHRPEWCLPAQGCALLREFAPLRVEAVDRTIVLRHQLYAGRDRSFHLFFTTVQDIPTGGERTVEDWTLSGRLRVAWQGVRSQRSQMIHLSCSGQLSVASARQRARDYLGRIIVPAS